MLKGWHKNVSAQTTLCCPVGLDRPNKCRSLQGPCWLSLAVRLWNKEENNDIYENMCLSLLFATTKPLSVSSFIGD